MTDPEDKGYTVKDRRFMHLSEEEKAKVREEEAARQEAAAAAEGAEAEGAKAEGGQQPPLPEITFSSFVISLSSSAFIHLGDIPDPTTGEVSKNLPLAKQTIDLLVLLREKTRNNLLEEEDKLFEHLLYDLRMRYIREAG